MPKFVVARASGQVVPRRRAPRRLTPRPGCLTVRRPLAVAGSCPPGLGPMEVGYETLLSESSKGAIVDRAPGTDLTGMAAAPGLVVGESLLASPELALVDADLRQSLCAVEYTPRPIFQETPAAIEDDGSVQRNLAAEPAEAASGDTPDVRDSEHRAEVVEQGPEKRDNTSSHYPVLPVSEADEGAIDETDVALRRIRERLADEAPVSTRKLRHLLLLPREQRQSAR